MVSVWGHRLQGRSSKAEGPGKGQLLTSWHLLADRAEETKTERCSKATPPDPLPPTGSAHSAPPDPITFPSSKSPCLLKAIIEIIHSNLQIKSTFLATYSEPSLT